MELMKLRTPPNTPTTIAWMHNILTQTGIVLNSQVTRDTVPPPNLLLLQALEGLGHVYEPHVEERREDEGETGHEYRADQLQYSTEKDAFHF